MHKSEIVTELISATYGVIRVKSDQLFHLTRGIIGFPQYKDYALIPMEEEPFYLFHSMDGELSFIVADASVIISDYEFEIVQDTIVELDIAKPEEIALFLIINIVDQTITANLKAPLILIPKHHTGCQYVIMDKDYSVRHPLSLGAE